MRLKPFPFYKQPDAKDCGPTCLRIVSRFYGKTIPLSHIRRLSETTREGSSLLNLSDAAEAIGFRSLGVKVDFETLKNEVPLRCIVHWNKVHFVVVYKIDKKETVYISDPAILFGQIMLFLGSTSIEVIRGWIMLHLSTRINISIISDFFIKLMALPISFFDDRGHHAADRRPPENRATADGNRPQHALFPRQPHRIQYSVAVLQLPTVFGLSFRSRTLLSHFSGNDIWKKLVFYVYLFR